jgi:N-acetylneuraminate synthase
MVTVATGAHDGLPPVPGVQSGDGGIARDVSALCEDTAPALKGRRNVAVVAELTTNHFGDRQRLETMIRASCAAGADYIKLQKRDVSTFYSPEQLAAPYASPFGTTFGEYRLQLELTDDDFAFADKLCGELGIGWFVSVLDEPSFTFIQQFSPYIIKLPSTISEHTDFLTHVARNFAGAVVLSTGMTDRTYEEFVLTTFVRAEQLFLLQCNSAYPTPPEDCNVAVVRHYSDLARKDSRIVPGYSSHDQGWLASAIAIGAGARMVEKHVKASTTTWAHFDEVAVDVCNGEFASYVRHLRAAETILGSPIKSPTTSEHHKYALNRPIGVRT